MAPKCSGYTNTTACMNEAYKIAANLNPSVAVGKGYQPPGLCKSDPYFPTWLKGVVFLRWNGSTLTENGGPNYKALQHVVWTTTDRTGPR